MNKNIIIICNTFFQLIMAVQIKRTIKSEDNMTLIITDQSAGAKEVYDRLLKTDIFEQVYFLKNRAACTKNGSATRFVRDVISGVTGKSPYFDFLEDKSYDELMFYNPDITTHFLFADLIKKNSELCVSRYEEGILSYNTVFPLRRKQSIIYSLRRFLRRKNLRDTVKEFYCVYPRCFKGQVPALAIPPISEDDVEFRGLVSRIFGTDGINTEYNEKYIYFSGVYDFEGGEPVGELELILGIKELVGGDNLLVKVHPRDDVNRFTSAGLKVDENSSLPWEAVQLSRDFNDKVFLTMVSGSVLSVNSILTKGARTHFLYPLCDTKGNVRSQHSVKALSDLLSESDIFKNVYVTDDLSQLKEI